MWTKPSDIRDKVDRWWDSGELMSELVSGACTFPRTLNFKKPTSSQLSQNFDDVRKWIAVIQSLTQCEIVWQEINHRVVGRNKIPIAAKFAQLEDAIFFAAKEEQFKRFEKIVEKIKQRKPAILPWLVKHPHEALALETEWDQLIDILSWFEQHPDRNIYLRQVDVPNVHTKMIEENKSTLTALLDLLLVETRANTLNLASKDFEERFGFRTKPLRVRFRILDQAHALLPTRENIQDLTLDSASFSDLDPAIKYVFITENEINFLAFPPMQDSMVIFGAGYGFKMLARATWLFKHKIFYWGDIDTHGLNILNSARKYLPHLRSIMMDEETLLAHREHWVEESFPFGAVDLARLTEKEHELYDDLREHQFGKQVRLEQEKLSWTFVENSIRNAISASASEKFANKLDSADTDKRFHFSDFDITYSMRPSNCDLRVYLNSHEPIPHVEGAYEVVLKERMTQLKTDAKMQFTEIADLSGLPLSDRTIVSNSALQSLSPCIFKPLLTTATSIDGNVAQIDGQPDFLIKEDQSYVVRNLTLARRISNHEGSESNTVLQLHGWLLSQVTGKPPTRLELQTSDGQIHIVEFDGGFAALKRITELCSIRNSLSKAYSPVGWTKCQGCDYQSRCWTAATEQKDVALLIGVDQKLSRILRRLGCSSVETLAENFDTRSLANLQKVVGEKFVRVGTRQAESILQMANAMIMQTHLTTNTMLLPKAEPYVVLDFEGLPSFANYTEFVFLWGMQYFGTDSGCYNSALSLNFERDNDMRAWLEFLQNSEKVFQAHGDIPFFHWHHYERTKLMEYIEKYGDSQNIGSRIIRNLVDLLPLVQHSIALPIPSYSLKVVEKYIGFERQQQPFGGEWVMAKYLEYMSASNSEVKDLCLQQILKYNEEDICATSAVLDWVRQNTEPVDLHRIANDQMT